MGYLKNPTCCSRAVNKKNFGHEFAFDQCKRPLLVLSPVLVCFSSRTPPSSSVMYLCNSGAWRSQASFPVDSRITPSTFRSSGSTTHYITQTIQQVAPPYILKLYSTQWRIQDFPQGVAPTPKSAIIFQFCSQKLHENERIWTPRGGACPWSPPLDPPMLNISGI